MARFLLTNTATVLCSHGGPAKAAMPATRVKANGAPVITGASPMIVTGCASPCPPAGPGPCLTATWMTTATRVRVQGVPVVCSDSVSIAAPTGTPLAVVVTQTRVRVS